jgi:hypothetical protein
MGTPESVIVVVSTIVLVTMAMIFGSIKLVGLAKEKGE